MLGFSDNVMFSITNDRQHFINGRPSWFMSDQNYKKCKIGSELKKYFEYALVFIFYGLSLLRRIEHRA